MSARDEIEERLALLTDQSGSVAPISAGERAARRERLAGLLASAGFDALLCEPGATLSWLTGVGWGISERLFAAVFLAGGSHFWLAPAFEERRARLALEGSEGPGGELVTWDEDEYAFAPLAAALRARRVERLCVEPAVRYGFVERLARELGRPPAPAAHDLVLALRGRKDGHELALLRRANELTQRALALTGELVRPGMTGAEIGAIARRAQERLGLADVWEIALIGPAAAFPHGSDERVELARGSVVLLDTGGALHGYQSDNTRTWVFDAEPQPDVARAWHAVRDAQRAAFDAIRPGVRCRAVDAAARAVIDAAGFGTGYRAFTHRLGHGIGLEGHEAPFLDGGSDVELAPGMTFSDEPGIYLPGRFGLRIEDVVAVTADGAEHFGSWQAGPRAPA